MAPLTDESFVMKGMINMFENTKTMLAILNGEAKMVFPMSTQLDRSSENDNNRSSWTHGFCGDLVAAVITAAAILAIAILA